MRVFTILAALAFSLALTGCANLTDRYPENPLEDWDHGRFTNSLVDAAKLALVRDLTGKSYYDQQPPVITPPSGHHPCKAEELTVAWAAQPWTCWPLGDVTNNFITDPDNWTCIDKVVNGHPVKACKNKTSGQTGCENRNGCARIPLDPSLIADRHAHALIANALADPCGVFDDPRSLTVRQARYQVAGIGNPAGENWALWRCAAEPGRRIKALSVTFGANQVVVTF